MVQNGVDVMEDVPLRDGAVAVASAKLFQRPVGDVLTAVGAVFGVGVEREALRTALGKLVCDYVRCEREKRPISTIFNQINKLPLSGPGRIRGNCPGR